MAIPSGAGKRLDIDNRSFLSDRRRYFAVSFYGWIYAVYFGLMVLDVVYARQSMAESDPAVTEKIFKEISDFLLYPFGLILLGGVAALGGALKHHGVVSLLLLSWLLPLAALTLYFLFGPSLDASGYGTLLRIVVFCIGSALAMLAFGQFVHAETEVR